LVRQLLTLNENLSYSGFPQNTIQIKFFFKEILFFIKVIFTIYTFIKKMSIQNSFTLVPYQNKFVVNLEMPNMSQPQFTLEICSDDTIYQVKQKIGNLESLKSLKFRPEKWELYLGGDLLKDERKISDYNISLGDNIRLHQKDAIQVFIRNTATLIEGRTLQSLAIFIDPNSTVLELKKEYHKKTSYPVENQIFIWGRYLLEDERSLSSYRIPHTATINNVVRLRGGL
jgi:hypothetical protein